MGNSLSKNKEFDATKVPIFRKRTGQQEVNPHNLHSKSVEVPEPYQTAVYGTYKTAKRYRPQDIDQKHPLQIRPKGQLLSSTSLQTEDPNFEFD